MPWVLSNARVHPLEWTIFPVMPSLLCGLSRFYDVHVCGKLEFVTWCTIRQYFIRKCFVHFYCILESMTIKSDGMFFRDLWMSTLIGLIIKIQGDWCPTNVRDIWFPPIYSKFKALS
jgi:hypothetical protein